MYKIALNIIFYYTVQQNRFCILIVSNNLKKTVLTVIVNVKYNNNSETQLCGFYMKT